MNLYNFFRHRGKPKAEPLAPICPNCLHVDQRPRNIARRIGGAIGALAGAAAGIYGVVYAARIGMDGETAPWPNHPSGPLMTEVASATLRGLIGGTLGAELGARAGGVVDRNILHTDRCEKCGFPFAAEDRPPSFPLHGANPMYGHMPDIDLEMEHDGSEPDGDDTASAGTELIMRPNRSLRPRCFNTPVSGLP